MTKNIVIFSDGTGQRSGERFEENRTNVYKLYRASKCGPDSSVDPNRQYAFYDPGIGTVPPKYGFFGTVWAGLYNLMCQATGLGLTKNIEDCYEAILRVYEPGDRIFLFGFSRGAYTVRCLAAVLHFCGVPRRINGEVLKKDAGTLRRLAREAVEDVYQHVSWERKGTNKEDRYIEQRRALAARFRSRCASTDAYPHFIGVFDTVATVWNSASLVVSIAMALTCVTIASAFLHLWFGSFVAWVVLLLVFAAGFAGIWYLKTHFKVAFGLEGHPWWTTAHLNPLHMRFYDKTLNTNVGWARHALAIDERRADFDRVPWGNVTELREVAAGQPDWLQQIWFAGNHADIGGGYPETQSRLSDAALAWMVNEATRIPDPLVVDTTVLRLYPAPGGMQHDETKSWTFRFARKIDRRIPVDARLDVNVLPRFDLSTVLHLHEEKPYRPKSLRGHEKTRVYYET
ncbi:MAG: DUF2235 domain-containing protein [Siculibacillus sp.]|nr:DUF2235 domain-containing protein [Siculibacillus sp.]